MLTHVLLLQVGNWSLESQYWGVYEGLTEATMPRPGYNVTTAAGASDLAGSMAAAFAASALVFKESDPAFAAELTTAATEMYTQVSMQDLSVMIMAVVVLVTTFLGASSMCSTTPDQLVSNINDHGNVHPFKLMMS